MKRIIFVVILSVASWCIAGQNNSASAKLRQRKQLSRLQISSHRTVEHYPKLQKLYEDHNIDFHNDFDQISGVICCWPFLFNIMERCIVEEEQKDKKEL